MRRGRDGLGWGLGPNGGGACRAAGVTPDGLIGTLGKALGTFGAFVAGSQDLIAWLTNRARSFVFSTAPPPSLAAAATHAIELAQGPEGTHRRERLARHRRAVAGTLAALELPVPLGEAPILPIVVGRADAALHLASQLRERGLSAPAIRPPTVPADTSRLRLSLSAAHSDEDIARLCAALVELRSQLR